MVQKVVKPDKPIAIHDEIGSFSDGWIAYCKANQIPYVLVDCYDTHIVEKVSGCSALMWHWSHNDASAAKFARQLIYSLESAGLRVFPNARTSWHFDDKLGQKYLFESLNIAHVPSYAFYHEAEARAFIERNGLPIVFKLSRGAGSKNVVLVKSLRQAEKIIRRCFGRGWSDRNRTYALQERVWRFRRDKNISSIIGIFKGIFRFIHPNTVHRTKRVESSYAYFQEFVPGNDSDIRVIIIGGRAIAIKRLTRAGDFRASGSGVILYDPTEIPLDCVRIAFDSASKLGMQTAAFDFVLKEGEPLIVEVSYGFSATSYRDIRGYWDKNLKWHYADIMIENMILESFLTEVAGVDS